MELGLGSGAGDGADGAVKSLWKVLGACSYPGEPALVVTLETVLTKGGGRQEQAKPPFTPGSPGEERIPPKELLVWSWGSQGPWCSSPSGWDSASSAA